MANIDEKKLNEKEQRELTFNGMTATEWALHSRSVWKDLPSPKEDKRFDYKDVLPIELLDRLINMYTKENDIVLDPFMKSGVSVISAIRNNRFCFGVEENEQYFKFAKYEIENSINLLVNGDYEIYNDNALNFIKKLKDESIQLIVSSIDKPFVDKKKKKIEDNDESNRYDEYIYNIGELLKNMYRVSKKGGYVIFVVEDYRDTKNTHPYVEMHADIARKGIDAGYLYQDVIIYDHNDRRGLLIQGYPKTFFANLNHAYIVVLRK